METSICQQVQFDLLEGRRNADHLGECAACRAFAAALDVADRTLPDLGEPPVAVDQLILAHAAKACGKPRRQPRLLYFALAAAAAAVIAFAVWPEKAGELNRGPQVARIVEGATIPDGPATAAVSVDVAEDVELVEMLETIADADYSGSHIDDELLSLELQLAAMTADAF